MPRTTPQYQQLLQANRKCSSTVLVCSALFSFKFQMLLVSHLAQSPRYCGEYTGKNWRTWNTTSLIYILLSYLIMMASAGVFIGKNGISTLGSFVAIEAIIISTFMAILLIVMMCSHSKNGKIFLWQHNSKYGKVSDQASFRDSTDRKKKD